MGKHDVAVNLIIKPIQIYLYKFIKSLFYPFLENKTQSCWVAISKPINNTILPGPGRTNKILKFRWYVAVQKVPYLRINLKTYVTITSMSWKPKHHSIWVLTYVRHTYLLKRNGNKWLVLKPKRYLSVLIVNNVCH